MIENEQPEGSLAEGILEWPKGLDNPVAVERRESPDESLYHLARNLGYEIDDEISEHGLLQMLLREVAKNRLVYNAPRPRPRDIIEAADAESRGFHPPLRAAVSDDVVKAAPKSLNLDEEQLRGLLDRDEFTIQKLDGTMVHRDAIVAGDVLNRSNDLPFFTPEELARNAKELEEEPERHD